MKANRKRYCPRCAERISRKAVRCHNCGTHTLPRAYKVAAALLAVVALAILLRLMNTL